MMAVEASSTVCLLSLSVQPVTVEAWHHELRGAVTARLLRPVVGSSCSNLLGQVLVAVCQTPMLTVIWVCGPHRRLYGHM